MACLSPLAGQMRVMLGEARKGLAEGSANREEVNLAIVQLTSDDERFTAKLESLAVDFARSINIQGRLLR